MKNLKTLFDLQEGKSALKGLGTMEVSGVKFQHNKPTKLISIKTKEAMVNIVICKIGDDYIPINYSGRNMTALDQRILKQAIYQISINAKIFVAAELGMVAFTYLFLFSIVIMISNISIGDHQAYMPYMAICSVLWFTLCLLVLIRFKDSY